MSVKSSIWSYWKSCVAGKLLIGPKEYSFAAVAAPYAQELLDLQTSRTFALDEFGKQVNLYLSFTLAEKC